MKIFPLTPRRNYLLELLNDLRFRRFSYERIEDTYTAQLSHYNGKQRHVTVPAVFDDCAIYELGPRLFNNNPWVTHIRIQEGVRTVCEDAFEDCVRLKSIHFPASCTDLQKQPFAGCKELSRVTIDPHNPSLRLVNGMLINRITGRLIFCLNRKDETMVVPEGVRIITSYAFMFCKQMKRIELPESIEKIESCAFSGSGLTEFPIPKIKPSVDPFCLDLGSILTGARVKPGTEAEALCQRSGLKRVSEHVDEQGFTDYRSTGEKSE